MCEYFTSEAYKNSERLGSPYQVQGKLYTRVKYKCPKCGGSGNYKNFGICYECNGSGYIIKEARLFTLEEKEEYQKNKNLTEEESEEKSKENWLLKHGFDKSGKTYIVLGDSFSKKDYLKSLGFSYSNYIKWHAATRPEAALELKQIDINDYCVWAPGTKSFVITIEGRSKLEEVYAEDQSNTKWYGNIGERFTNLKVTLTDARQKETDFGVSHYYTFKDESNHIFIWKTTIILFTPVNQSIYLTATIRSHWENPKTHGKITYIQRAKVEEIK